MNLLKKIPHKQHKESWWRILTLQLSDLFKALIEKYNRWNTYVNATTLLQRPCHVPFEVSTKQPNHPKCIYLLFELRLDKDEDNKEPFWISVNERANAGQVKPLPADGELIMC